jgi:hypothetical protein
MIESEIVTARWNEAVQNPDIARWRSLAYFAGYIADKMLDADPNNIQGHAMRGVSFEAHNRMLDMQSASWRKGIK